MAHVRFFSCSDLTPFDGVNSLDKAAHAAPRVEDTEVSYVRRPLSRVPQVWSSDTPRDRQAMAFIIPRTTSSTSPFLCAAHGCVCPLHMAPCVAHAA